MDNQDWNPTILRNGKAVQTRITAEKAAKPKVSAEAIRLAKLATNDEGVIKRPKVLSIESRQAMMRLRAEQKWSQKDVDMKCSFPSNTLRDIENGKVTPSQAQLTMLSRLLKVIFKLE